MEPIELVKTALLLSAVAIASRGLLVGDLEPAKPLLALQTRSGVFLVIKFYQNVSAVA